MQLAAARALIGRGARDSYAALRPFLDAKTDPELHGLALVSAEASTLDNLAQVVAAGNAGDPKVAQLALATYRARLARAERTAAGDLLLSAALKLSPTERADAMAEWLAGGKTLNASGATATTTASVTPKR